MKKKFLDSIEVKSPCHENWDEMIGNDEVRFCSHCAKDVHNISAMTLAKAEKLVKESNGKLCVRYYKTPQGKMISAPPKLTQITRRGTIAASVLATSLALSTLAYAQGEPLEPKVNSTQTKKGKSEKRESKQRFSIISGTVKDPQGAVVPEAKVTLLNTKTQKIRVTQTNYAGTYEFKRVEPGFYEITVESFGFKKLVAQNIEVLKDVKLEQNLVLEIAPIMGACIVIKEPIETTESKPDKNIQQRPLVQLPPNNQNITMGFVMTELPTTSKNVLDLLKLQPTNPKGKKKKN